MPIFDDVSEVVSFLPGTSVDDIALGILDFYKEKTSQNKFITEVNSAREEWLHQHRFSRVSARLQGIIRGVETNKQFNN